MEELLKNFSYHISNNINSNIGNEIEEYVDKAFSINSLNEEYDEIEHDIKSKLANYFKNCDKKEFLKIAQNLYNVHIENDDNNLINAIKIFVRFYTKFTEMKVKRMFYKWRINMMYNESITPYKKNNIVSNNNSKNKIPTSPKDIFNKLYMNAIKKQDEKLLNDEIKRLSELEECTFKPNITKKKN